ncbi:gamma carbonic anhydrase family protein [Nocardia cyriacigeorgica]|uniref:Gamma carbonic anhydrase family protein n=1 Tax=Nocardia cyriacigeorgica TaxID=135487 RepID=A0ABX0CG13_9NOCA|nr:gamma carbonic anhydrase family protein [Nocardia cyriacigeorgica]NEW54781.1 gamma carbonic anhydrase family protein [Nocardia cyriacigeorgica]
MPLYEFEGKRPQVDPSAFVAPTATLIGDVTVEAGASIWYGAVLRADLAPIVIRERANIQDNAVLHVPPDVPMEIGPGATIAHSVVFHGASVGAETIIGNGTTVLDMAKIGAGSMVAAHSLVPPGAEIPDGVLAAGAPAQVKRPLEGTKAQMWVQLNPGFYADLAQRHRTGITEV